jgi:hypothetical protein
MKAAINQITRKIIKSDLVWKGLWPFIKASNYLQYHRGVVKKEEGRQRNDETVIKLLGAPVVKNGPFKGMKYPAFASYGSAIFPKIVGSYECELHPLLEQTSNKKYTTILDIGSAEGYYAVGLALRFPGVPVYAYDVNELANEACREMAALNGVKEQVRIESFCSPEILARFNFGTRSLIICDCEGFEKELFTDQNLNNLKNCDLLIETHDFINIYISDYLKELFSNTHHITSIYSLDDIVKARSYDFPELQSLDLKNKMEILAEKRPAIMEWIYLEPK